MGTTMTIIQGVMILLTAPPVLNKTTDPSQWTDWRTWVGAAVLALLATAQMWGKALKERWDQNHKRKEAIEDKTTERLDELHDTLVQELRDQIKRIEVAHKEETDRLEADRKFWQDKAFRAIEGQANQVRAEIAGAAMRKSYHGATPSKLDEVSEDL